MGTNLTIVDFNEEFATLSGPAPTIINDIQAFSEEKIDALNKLMYTTYSGDQLSNIPTCDCGDIQGEYNLGVFCEVCRTTVQSVLDQDLKPRTWIRAPIGVKALVNPKIWTMLKNHFKIGNFHFINWLCDTNYQASYTGQMSASIRNVISIIESMNIQRGFNYFVDNFDDIIQKLFTIHQFKPKKGERNSLLQLLVEHRHKVFTQYLPIPHRSLLVVEETDVGVFVDPITTKAIDAIRTLAGIDSELNTYAVRTKENRTVKAIDGISSFSDDIVKETMASKEGTFRKHVFATRSHFGFRAVISSITDAHRHDQIYISWGVATCVFRLHLINKLYKRGYTPNEAIKLINSHARTYNPLLDELFKEIINEAPSGKGVACTLNRNPSLGRGSIQKVFIAKVKPDPGDQTISISILIVRPLNAD